MEKGYSVECFSRQYLTRWTREQCLGFLSRKNSFDLFEYEFERGEACVINFLWKWADRLKDYRKLNIAYGISFGQTEAGTVLTLSCVEHGKNPRGILKSDLDEFFRVKLDAVPC